MFLYLKKTTETVLKKNRFPILIISGFNLILFCSFCWLALGETMRHLSSAEYTSQEKDLFSLKSDMQWLLKEQWRHTCVLIEPVNVLLELLCALL